MILLNSTDSLQVLLGAAVAANQCALYATYVDMAADGSTFAPGANNGQTNSATAVSWISAPAAGKVRQVKYLSLYNADTASVVVTVRINDGTNTRTLTKITLAAGDRLEYNVDVGFRSVTASGSSAAVTSVNGAAGIVTVYDTWCIAVSDESTAIAAGTSKVTFYAPYACTIDDVFIGLSSQSTSGSVTADVNKAGSSIFSTNPSIDANEDTSLTGTAAALSTTALAKGDKITIDIDAPGTGAKGLKVFFRVHY